MVYSVERIDGPSLLLGEGTVWHPARQWLCFVDIEGGLLFTYDPAKGQLDCMETGGMTGFVVPCKDQLVAGVADRLCLVHLDQKTLTPLMRVPMGAGLRFNDGKCDPQGRLWVGTMEANYADQASKGKGSLYCIREGTIVQQIVGMSIPNGMAWGEGGVFYHTDTATGCIDAYRIAADGSIHAQRQVVQFAATMGAPDGFCMDAEGMLWVALWGSGQVRRLNPVTGKMLPEVVALPEKNVSCCCFGGSDLGTLYITTAAGKGEQGHVYACSVPMRGTLPFDYKKN